MHKYEEISEIYNNYKKMSFVTKNKLPFSSCIVHINKLYVQNDENT